MANELKRKIETVLDRLERYCRARSYAGWDPYDGLNARLLQATPFFRFRVVRLAWIQLCKRSPVNLRPLFGVPRARNPKGLALFASGYVALGRLREAKRMLDELAELRSREYAETCWGYHFPWQARAFYVPQGTPNLVTTVFAARAYLDYHDRTGDETALRTARDACRFLVRHLVLEEDEDRLCFAYVPGESARVHNVNMLAAALLARVHALTGERALYAMSIKAMTYSMQALRQDYSWPYGERSHHRFVDSFHTGYNLEALHEWMACTGDERWRPQLEGAYRYYLDTFWLPDGRPKYYRDRVYPVDIHCSAQGVLTCCRLAALDSQALARATTMAEWALEHMLDGQGYFYFQRQRWYTNKIPYMRWSQAWMFLALCVLAQHLGTQRP